MAAKPDRTCDGIVFASKKEMQHYQGLKIWESARPDQRKFLRQVSFPLPGHISYRCDFLTFEYKPEWNTDEGPLLKMSVIDVKGMKTDVYRIKKRLFEATYPWKIREV